jgi:hypothetical protein
MTYIMAQDPITRAAKQYKENATTKLTTTKKERTTNKLTTTQKHLLHVCVCMYASMHLLPVIIFLFLPCLNFFFFFFFFFLILFLDFLVYLLYTFYIQ